LEFWTPACISLSQSLGRSPSEGASLKERRAIIGLDLGAPFTGPTRLAVLEPKPWKEKMSALAASFYDFALVGKRLATGAADGDEGVVLAFDPSSSVRQISVTGIQAAPVLYPCGQI
jgi:hypothetical protein